MKNAKPVFGTFTGHPSRLDIRGVQSPYSTLPLPLWITNLRIKSRLSVFFNLGPYIGCVDFFDAKIFGFSDVCFWNKETKQRFVYRSVMGPRKRFVPHNLNIGFTANYKKHRYARISWDRNRGMLSLIFNLKGNRVRPSSNGALIADTSSEEASELTLVMPSPIVRRCSAHYMQSVPLHGAITLDSNGDIQTMNDSDGQAFFDMSRTYMKFHTKGEFLTGLGSVNGKQLVFRLQVSTQDAIERDRYNANAMFYGGDVTALPPVVITHPYGMMNTWFIQDTEGMVDLSFTPVSDNPNVISAFVLRSEYHTMYGTFEGTLVTGSGEKISFKSLAGITKKYMIRL